MKTDKKWCGHMEWHEGYPQMRKNAFGEDYLVNDGWMTVQIVKLDGSGELHRLGIYPTRWDRPGCFKTDWVYNKCESEFSEVNGVTPEQMVTYDGRVKYQRMILKELFGVDWDDIEWID